MTLTGTHYSGGEAGGEKPGRGGGARLCPGVPAT